MLPTRSQSPLALNPSSHSQSPALTVLAIRHSPTLVSSRLSGYFMIYGWGVHDSGEFFLSYFYSFKKFIFSYASRNPGIRSLGAVLPTHYTPLPPHYTQAVHPISLIIIRKCSFPPPSTTSLCLNITHCGSRQSQQWALPSLTERLPSHRFGH